MRGRIEVGQAPHAHRVVVATREETRTRGRAERRRVEVGVAKAPFGQTVVVRGVDQPAVATQVGEAGVVEKHHDHVRRAGSRQDGFGPPRGGLAGGATDDLVALGCCGFRHGLSVAQIGSLLVTGGRPLMAGHPFPTPGRAICPPPQATWSARRRPLRRSCASLVPSCQVPVTLSIGACVLP